MRILQAAVSPIVVPQVLPFTIELPMKLIGMKSILSFITDIILPQNVLLQMVTFSREIQE